MKKVFTVLIALCLAAVLLPQPTAAQAADTAHQFTLVTDIADVLSGGQFVIVSVYGSAYSGAMGTTITPRTDFSYMNEIKPVRVTINNFGKVFDDDSEVDPVAFTTATDKSDVTVSGNNLPIWTIAPTGNGVSLYANGSYLAYDYTATASPTPYSWSVIPGEDNGFVFFSNGGILCYTYSNRDSYGVVSNGNITPGIHVRDMLLFKLQGEHTYTSKVTPPTCTKNGYTTYTCTICGDSYVEATETHCVLARDYYDVRGGGRFVIVASSPNKTYGALSTAFPQNGYFNEIDSVPVTIENLGPPSDGFEDDELDLLSGTSSMDSATWGITGKNLPIWTLEPTGSGMSMYADGRYLVYDVSRGFTASSKAKGWGLVSGNNSCYIHSDVMELGYIESAQNEYTMYDGRYYNPDITTSTMLMFKVVDGSALGHSCDPCPVKYPTCTENGIMTYICNRCTYTYAWETPAEGHSYTSKVTAPTCTENGYTTYTCTICGDSYVAEEVPALGHHDVDGACTQCGRTVTAPTLIGTSFTLSFENEILLNFYYTAENTQDVTEQGMLVFYSDPGEADFAKANDVYTGSVLSNDTFANTTKGIAAKEMGDERYYCAYAKLTDGSYAYSPLYSYSPEKYAIGRIQNSSNEELKALCVAMLNYGAAAQEFFGYRTDDLMNAGLTEAQQALVANYDAALFAGAVPANPDKSGAFAATDTGFTKRSATVSFEGAFVINYYFTPEFAVADSMKLYIWNSEAYESAQTLTADNAAVQVMTEQNGSWFASVRGIAPKDLDKTFYVAGVYTDGDGNTHCTGVIAYSLSRYCMNNAKPGKPMQQLAASTAMYGYYADNYFA